MISESKIKGTWQAYQIIENGEILEADLSAVNLIFSKKGRYQYNGTLNYREAGSFFIDMPYL